jgi:PAS domain S-box-containing protein
MPTAPEDFQTAFFDALPDPAYAIDRAYRIVAVNVAGERHFGMARSMLLSRIVWEALPRFVGTAHEEILRRVAQTERSEQTVVDCTFHPGRRLKVRVFPFPSGVGVVLHDVTDAERTLADLAVSEALRRASEERARSGLAELRAIYDSAPIGLCVVDRERRFRRVNARMAAINGAPAEAHLGRTVAELVPGLVDPSEPLFRRILETGEPILGIEISGETPAQPGTKRHWQESWHPLLDASGGVVAVNIVAEEITERKAAAEREQLLVRELQHRARNVLMVVSSLVQLTAKGDPARFVPVLQERLKALARAHEITGRDQDRADIGALVRTELAAHADGSRLVIEGPPVALDADAAQALGMTIHELATNAAKYGALGTPDGRLAATWAKDGDEVVMTWTEKGGPPVCSPQRDGFGSLLIRVNVVTRLRGTFDPRWDPDGFSCTLRLPLCELARSFLPA